MLPHFRDEESGSGSPFASGKASVFESWFTLVGCSSKLDGGNITAGKTLGLLNARS